MVKGLASGGGIADFQVGNVAAHAGVDVLD